MRFFGIYYHHVINCPVLITCIVFLHAPIEFGDHRTKHGKESGESGDSEHRIRDVEPEQFGITPVCYHHCGFLPWCFSVLFC